MSDVLLVLSMSMMPFTAIAAVDDAFCADELVVFISATFVYVVSNAKSSRNARQLPADALTRMKRTAARRLAALSCGALVGLGVGAGASGAKLNVETEPLNVKGFVHVVPLTASSCSVDEY